MSILSDATTILLDEGLKSFCKRGFEYVRRELSKLYIRFSPPLPQKTVTVEVDEATATFSVSSPITVERTNHLMGERPIISKLLSNIQPNDTFYDIGANIGLYSCLVSEILVDGEVVAFEPSASNVLALSQNISINQSNVTIISVALTNFTGLVNFDIDGDEPGVGTHSISKATDSQMRVGAFSSGQLIRKGDLSAPDVLKVDVEGAEMSVLQGFQGHFENIRSIFCEIHGDNSEDIKHLLRENEFCIEVLLDRESEQFIHAYKTDRA